jgi:hypothetical protein
MMEGVNSRIIYFIYFKNFCKCHNVPPSSTTIKKRGKKEKKERGIPTMRVPNFFKSDIIMKFKNTTLDGNFSKSKLERKH